MREDTVPILIPVYNTPPETIYFVVHYLRVSTGNPVVIVNDGSSREETVRILSYIRETGLAIVIDKENGGKIDAIRVGLEYVVKQFNPRCVFIMDDDIIPYPMVGKSLDDLLREKCSLLSGSTPVAVFPVANQVYARAEFLRNIASAGAGVFLELSLPKLSVKPNALDYIQNIEHIASSNHARLLAGNGLWVGGSGSLWLTVELMEVLSEHSGEHAADDLELSVLLLRKGRGIAFYNDLTLYAELVSRPLKFIKQRLYWSYGALRVLVKHPDILLPKRGSNPLYTMYILNPYILLVFIALPLPVALKEAVGIIYGALVLAQAVTASRRQLGRIVVLVGGALISTLSLLTSLSIRLVTGSNETAGYTMLMGAVSSLIYTLALLYRVNNSRNNYLKLRAVDFIVLALYALLYSLIIMPMGSLLYIYRDVKKTYKIT